MNKSKQKRRTSLLFIMMMVIVLVIAACGGSGGSGGSESSSAGSGTGGSSSSTSSSDSESSSSETSGSDNESGASELSPHEIKLVFVGAEQNDEKLVEEAMNEILQEKINATVDIMMIDWGPWDDRMNLMIASREEVDVLFTAQWNGHANNVARGAYLPLNDLLEEHGQGILNTLDPAFLEGAKINGLNYGIPTNKELASAGGIVYRKDIADELGLDMEAVQTPEDLDAIYAVIKEQRPDIIPLFTSGDLFTSHFFVELDFLGDGDIPGALLKSQDDTTVKMAHEFDDYMRYLYLARDFYQKGYINADAATTQLSGQDAYMAGNVFSTVEPMKPGKADEIANAAGLSGKLGQITLTGKTVATSETAGAMLAISSTSTDPERAMMFIDLLHTDKDLINLLVFGLEDVHYTRNGEIISATPDTGNYSHGAAWQLGNQFLNYVWDSEEPDKWEQFREFNEGAKPSPALGFVFDSQPVVAEVGALANVIRQYDRALATGSVDVDEVLPEYIDALKAAGVDVVIEEKQRQLDEFLANK